MNKTVPSLQELAEKLLETQKLLIENVESNNAEILVMWACFMTHIMGLDEKLTELLKKVEPIFQEARSKGQECLTIEQSDKVRDIVGEIVGYRSLGAKREPGVV